MHLNPALITIVASLTLSIGARSIPPNARYRAAALGSRKSHPHEHSIFDDCMRPYNVESLLESNLQTRFLVKSLGIEELQQMLGVYITGTPNTRTCTCSPPACATDDVCGYLCTPPLVSVGTLPAVEGNLCQSLPPAAYSANLRRLAKQGKPNETTCGSIDGSANAFKCVGTETRPDSCGGCTVLSTIKGRYGSRFARTDCTAVEHADAVSCISDECAAESYLARWSFDDDDDDATGCVEEQVPDTPSSAGQASRAKRLHEARRGLEYEIQQNTTSVDHVKPQARWIPRRPNTHWLGKRDASVAHEQDGVADIGSGRIKEDWTRIPDYRRHLA